MQIAEALTQLAIPVDVPKRMTIINPVTRKPMADKNDNIAYIELYSSESDVFRNYRKRMVESLDPGKPLSPEDVEAQAAEMLVACTKSWFLVSPGGEPMDYPFSVEAAKELYGARELVWLRQQADAFVSNVANFANWS